MEMSVGLLTPIVVAAISPTADLPSAIGNVLIPKTVNGTIVPVAIVNATQKGTAAIVLLVLKHIDWGRK